MTEEIKKYIEDKWDECIKENREDNGTLIGMPYPYTVPAVGHFDEMYYWDTYFTNKGLECSGRFAQAKNNTDNMLYMVNRYGYMPNGNRTYYLKSSQPPFLSIMVRDVYEHYKDKLWLKSAYDGLNSEYGFWMGRRLSPMGLNVYGGEMSPSGLEFMAGQYEKRTGLKPQGDIHDFGYNSLLTCESGWDMTPRWGTEGYNYAPVDLNSLMYMLEENMCYFATELKNGLENEWRERAEKRRGLMLQHMDNGSGLLFDYNYKTDSLSSVFSAASYYPLFAGLADESHAQAAAEALPKLEAEYGILTCEKQDNDLTYQWGYPNGWACLQYIVYMGLDRYGYKKEAKNVAEKYLTLAEKVFKETNHLWEKYNVVEGSTNIKSGSKTMPPMMGWSAGVYLAAAKYLGK